jgi:hypothetical protein
VFGLAGGQRSILMNGVITFVENGKEPILLDETITRGITKLPNNVNVADPNAVNHVAVYKLRKLKHVTGVIRKNGVGGGGTLLDFKYSPSAASLKHITASYSRENHYEVEISNKDGDKEVSVVIQTESEGIKEWVTDAKLGEGDKRRSRFEGKKNVQHIILNPPVLAKTDVTFVITLTEMYTETYDLTDMKGVAALAFFHKTTVAQNGGFADLLDQLAKKLKKLSECSEKRMPEEKLGISSRLQLLKAYMKDVREMVKQCAGLIHGVYTGLSISVTPDSEIEAELVPDVYAEWKNAVEELEILARDMPIKPCATPNSEDSMMK